MYFEDRVDRIVVCVFVVSILNYKPCHITKKQMVSNYESSDYTEACGCYLVQLLCSPTSTDWITQQDLFCIRKSKTKHLRNHTSLDLVMVIGSASLFISYSFA